MLKLLGKAFFATVILGACAFVAWHLGVTYEVTRTIAVAHVPGRPLTVTTRNGSITVKRAQGNEVIVTARLRARTQHRLDETKVRAERDAAGNLVVDVDSPGGISWRDGCSFEIAIPDVSAVTLRTTNGSVRTTGLSGAADLKSTNGRIECLDHDGAVTAATTNGRIEVRLADDVAGPLDLRSTNGRIEVSVGPAFGGTFAAKTTNGRIDVGESLRGSVVESSRTSSLLQLGGDAQPSSVRTTNGSIRIQRRASRTPTRC